jgi:hypothetical protein
MKQMSELTNVLLTIRNSELDHQRSLYIASAGIVMAGIDEEMSRDEYETIIQTLASYMIFPKELFMWIIENKSQEKHFRESAAVIMQYNPAERDPMFEFLISVALSDSQIFTKEINFLYQVGAELFHYSAKEIAQKIAYVIRGNFIPKLYS